MAAKVTLIRIEYDDGSYSTAFGEHAENIMKFWLNCETMNYIHGGKFTGKSLDHFNKEIDGNTISKEVR